MTNNTTGTIGGFVILAGIIAAIVTLALHGTITGSNAMEAIIAIVGIGGGAVSHASGVAAGANAASSSTTTPTQPG